MGAWGYEIFDDDTPYFFIEEVAIDPLTFFAKAINIANTTDYLEYDDGQAVLVSAAYLDNLLNQTHYPNDNEDSEGIDNVNNFYRLRPDLDASSVIKGIVNALAKVLDDQSELNELWSENEELYPLWKANIEGIKDRLSSYNAR